MSLESREEHITLFFQLVTQNIRKSMEMRDAIELAAITVGGLIPAKVSQAMAKYQEAIHPESHLSQEEDKDTLALLSMGVLWDNTYFNPIIPDESMIEENTLAEAIYLIMVYSTEEYPLEKIIEVNNLLPGDMERRGLMIQKILEV